MLNNLTRVFSTLIKNCRNTTVSSLTQDNSVQLLVRDNIFGIGSVAIDHYETYEDYFFNNDGIPNLDVEDVLFVTENNLCAWKVFAYVLQNLGDMVLRNCTNLYNATMLESINGSVVGETTTLGNVTSMGSAISDYRSSEIIGEEGMNFAAGFLTASCVYAFCYMIKQCVGIIRDRNRSSTSSNSQNSNPLGDLQMRPRTMLEDVRVNNDQCFFVNAERSV